jgi:hypothetical protein
LLVWRVQDCAPPTPAEPKCNERSQINYERFRYGNEPAAARADAPARACGRQQWTYKSARASRPDELLGNPKK